MIGMFWYTCMGMDLDLECQYNVTQHYAMLCYDMLACLFVFISRCFTLLWPRYATLCHAMPHYGHVMCSVLCGPRRCIWRIRRTDSPDEKENRKQRKMEKWKMETGKTLNKSRVLFWLDSNWLDHRNRAARTPKLVCFFTLRWISLFVETPSSLRLARSVARSLAMKGENMKTWNVNKDRNKERRKEQEKKGIKQEKINKETGGEKNGQGSIGLPSLPFPRARNQSIPRCESRPSFASSVSSRLIQPHSIHHISQIWSLENRKLECRTSKVKA